MQIKFEETLDNSIKKQLEDWQKTIQGDAPPITGFDELPKDHPDYATVNTIRQELIAKGIDPATVYPIDFDFVDQSDPVTVAVTFDYKHYEETKNAE